MIYCVCISLQGVFMKDLRKLFGIIFVAAVIVCAMASCDFSVLGGGGGTGDSTPTTPTTPVTPTTPGSGTVTGVYLNKSSVTLLAGGTEALTASITPSNATNQNLTWTSSNTSAATVSEGGLVTAIAVGTATITVKTQDGDKTASCTVTVNPIAVSGVSLKSSTSLAVGGTETLYAVIDPPNASNQSVTWDSNNIGVATVSENGVVTAVVAGTATITVKTQDGNKTADCIVTVVTSPIAVTGVSLNKSSTSIDADNSEYLYATITPSNATNQNVTWTSSNDYAATVSASGLVTAVAVGTATITVKTQDGDKTASCAVTVNAIPVSGVSLKSSTSLEVGGTETLYATITPANATNQNVTWNSSDTGVATVSANGLVTAVAAGTATITVTTADGNKTAACTVTVTASIPTFTSIADMASWLKNQSANSVATTYNVKLNVNNLGGGSFSSGSAGKALRDNATKYVSLDLSGSSFTSIVSSDGTPGFYNCYNLTSVTIPDNVTKIDPGAFAYCNSLTAINVVASSNNTFTSEDGVLYNKNKTTLVCYPGGKAGSFTIPNSVTSIGSMTFTSCNGLTGVTIPNSVTSIGNMAFDGCTSLTSVTIGNSVTSIGVHSFAQCFSLPSIIIPDSVTSIESGAFWRCTSLTSVTIGNSVTSIGATSFDLCIKLTAINVASGNNAYTSVNGVLYNKDKTTLVRYPAGKTGSFTIPDSVTSIWVGAFQNSSGLTSVNIPSSVTSIEGFAFYECAGLTSITILNNVTSIGVSAFSYCTSLTSVTFEGTIASNKLDTDAFGSSQGSIGDLREKYLAGGPGIYTRPTTGRGGSWTRTGDAPGGGVAPGGTYIITGSGASFTATNSGATIGTANKPIQDVIDAIRIHAAGKDLTIQFGNGTATLDIGEKNASINNNFGDTWGAVTLTGKITSRIEDQGTIYIRGSVSVTSTADIANTYPNGVAIYHYSNGTLSITSGTVSASNMAVLNYSTGTVTISGGTVSAKNAVVNNNTGVVTISGGTVSSDGTYSGTPGYAVNNSFGALHITGGTIFSKSGFAVYGWLMGTITVSGTAKVTSASTNGTIFANATSGGGKEAIKVLEITGGTVENTGTGDAVYVGSSTVSITGGTVSATSGCAVNAAEVTVSGTAKVTSTSGCAVSAIGLTVSGTAQLTSANTDTAEGTIYIKGNRTTTATQLEITGGRVENTSTTTGNAIRNDSSGAVSITGGTVSKAGNGNYAVYNDGAGKVTIGPGATIVGRNYGVN